MKLKSKRTKTVGKRLISVFLTVAALLAALTVNGFAAWGDSCPSQEYADVPAEGSWAHEGIDYVIGMGVMLGTADKAFSPDMAVTREMMVTILYRLAYAWYPTSMEVSGSSSFSDVRAGQWYSDAIAWAEEAGLTGGVGGGRFGVGQELTREQLVTFLYRYVEQFTASSVAVEEPDLSQFSDADQVSGWAAQAVAWGVATEAIQGAVNSGALCLDPSGSATRAQTAAILFRLADLLERPVNNTHIRVYLDCVPFTITNGEGKVYSYTGVDSINHDSSTDMVVFYEDCDTTGYICNLFFWTFDSDSFLFRPAGENPGQGNLNVSSQYGSFAANGDSVEEILIAPAEGAVSVAADGGEVTLSYSPASSSQSLTQSLNLRLTGAAAQAQVVMTTDGNTCTVSGLSGLCTATLTKGGESSTITFQADEVLHVSFSEDGTLDLAAAAE